jgi:ElaB/YqjD/DUF883 family membrane-anchored ribosome-binding protein
MGEVRRNELQSPAPEIRASASQRSVEALEEGLAAGREWTRKATQRTLDWIEGHPGPALLVAAGVGFVLGQILFRRGPRLDEDLED